MTLRLPPDGTLKRRISLVLMNVSWNDVNQVQEPGQFPFRDGTIDVTFAEIAIWKLQPDAQFQLMRKNPIQGQIAYVLGKRI